MVLWGTSDSTFLVGLFQGPRRIYLILLKLEMARIFKLKSLLETRSMEYDILLSLGNKPHWVCRWGSALICCLGMWDCSVYFFKKWTFVVLRNTAQIYQLAFFCIKNLLEHTLPVYIWIVHDCLLAFTGFSVLDTLWPLEPKIFTVLTPGLVINHQL